MFTPLVLVALGIIDLGFVGRLDSQMLTSMRDLFNAVTTQDGPLATRAVPAVAPPAEGADTSGLERTLSRFIESQFGPLGGGATDERVRADLRH